MSELPNASGHTACTARGDRLGLLGLVQVVNGLFLAARLLSPAGPARSTVVGRLDPLRIPPLVATRASVGPLTGWVADHRWSCPSWASRPHNLIGAPTR